MAGKGRRIAARMGATMITDSEISAVLARVDAVLDDYEHARDVLWAQARARRRPAPAAVASAPAKPDLPGGAPVENPQPRPVKPPSGASVRAPAEAVILPHGMARRATLAALGLPQHAADEISF
jgi:hypothetical protein